MTPKFDKLLGALRENGAGAAAAPSVGGVSYFAADPGAGWLKCDGGIHLRSAHPQYEAQRPDPAWRFRELVNPGLAAYPRPASSNGFQLGRFTYFLDFNPNDFSYNMARYDSATGVTIADPIPGLEGTDVNFDGVVFGDGRVVVFISGSQDAWVSEDGGVTWSVVTNALPFPWSIGGTRPSYWVNELSFLRPLGETSQYLAVVFTDQLYVNVFDALDTTPALAGDNFAFAHPTIPVISSIYGSLGYLCRAAPFDAFVAGGAGVFTPRNETLSPNPLLDSLSHKNVGPILTNRGWVNPYVERPPSLLKLHPETSSHVLDFLTSELLQNPSPVVKAFGNQILFAEFDFEAWETPSTAFGFLPQDALHIERMMVAGHIDLQALGGSCMHDDIDWGQDRKAFIDGQERSVIFFYDASWENEQFFEVYLDPLYFHAPGLSPQRVTGAWPYVYVGA